MHPRYEKTFSELCGCYTLGEKTKNKKEKKMSNNDDFDIPEKKDYLKFQEGINHFRILEGPLKGWMDWNESENKPIHYTYEKGGQKPEPISSSRDVSFFMAFVVWNYKEECIQVLKITQMGILKMIKSYKEDPDWGDIFSYDFKVERTGSSLQTEYETKACPKKLLKPEILEAYKKKPAKLEALFKNEDCFKR
jgi:hypothetical protein